MTAINEDSVFQISLSYEDFTGAAVTPGSARYKIENPDTGTLYIDWTTFTPSTSNTLTIPYTAQAVESADPEENRTITVQTDYGTSLQHTSSFAYQVRNLSGVGTTNYQSDY